MAETTKKEETSQNLPTGRPAKPTNCAKCNKPLKKKIWYYRNGKYYCSKTCWRLSLKTEKPSAPA